MSREKGMRLYIRLVAKSRAKHAANIGDDNRSPGESDQMKGALSFQLQVSPFLSFYCEEMCAPSKDGSPSVPSTRNGANYAALNSISSPPARASIASIARLTSGPQ